MGYDCKVDIFEGKKLFLSMKFKMVNFHLNPTDGAKCFVLILI